MTAGAFAPHQKLWGESAPEVPWRGFAQRGKDRGAKTVRDARSFLELDLRVASNGKGTGICTPACARVVQALLKISDWETRTCKTTVGALCWELRTHYHLGNARRSVQRGLKEADRLGFINRLPDTNCVNVRLPWASMATLRALANRHWMAGVAARAAARQARKEAADARRRARTNVLGCHPPLQDPGSDLPPRGSQSLAPGGAAEAENDPVAATSGEERADLKRKLAPWPENDGGAGDARETCVAPTARERDESPRGGESKRQATAPRETGAPTAIRLAITLTPGVGRDARTEAPGPAKRPEAVRAVQTIRSERTGRGGGGPDTTPAAELDELVRSLQAQAEAASRAEPPAGAGGASDACPGDVRAMSGQPRAAPARSVGPNRATERTARVDTGEIKNRDPSCHNGPPAVAKSGGEGSTRAADIERAPPPLERLEALGLIDPPRGPPPATTLEDNLTAEERAALEAAQRAALERLTETRDEAPELARTPDELEARNLARQRLIDAAIARSGGTVH